MSSVGDNNDSTNRVSKACVAVEKNHSDSSTNVGGFQPRAPVRDPTLLRNALVERCSPTRIQELLLQNALQNTRSYALRNALVGRANGAQFGNSRPCSVFGNTAASPGAYIVNASSVVINHYNNGVGGVEASLSTGPSQLPGTYYPVSKKIKPAPVAPVAPVAPPASISPEVSIALRYLGDLIGRSPNPEALLTLVQEWLRRVVVSDTLGGGEGSNANPANSSQSQELPGNGVLPS